MREIGYRVGESVAAVDRRECGGGYCRRSRRLCAPYPPIPSSPHTLYSLSTAYSLP